MTRDKIKEGDICTLDESVAYSYYPHKPYEVVVLWHGVNSQPLVTKLDAYKPFWTTYSQLIEVNRHIDLSIKALEQQTCEDAVSREAVLGLFAQNADATRPYSKTWEEVKALPPVDPQQRVGHWEWVQYDSNPNIGNWHCSECRSIVIKSVKKEKKDVIFPLYIKCPQCGCRIVEPQESEGT